MIAFFGLSFDYQRAFDHLNMNLFIYYSHTASFRVEFTKFRILEILNFHPNAKG